MRTIKIFLATGLLFWMFLSSNIYALVKTTITDYQATFIPIYDQKDNLNIAIRMYSMNGDLYFLCVDPYSLQTKTILAKEVNFRGKYVEVKRNYFLWQNIAATPYLKLLTIFSQQPYHTENHGITRAKGDLSGVFLTIDLCPSGRAFEKRLFSPLGLLADKLQHPTPVAISISGSWLLGHQKEFIWLLDQQTKGKLAITWVNHSFSHPYYIDLPMPKNFLVFNARNFSQEVLMTEKLLLEYGQKPSVFFRFPGLVANRALIQELKNFGLLPIGSDAWLAKNQQPKKGSFILIHGNSNEPKGVDKFLLLINNYPPNFLPLNLGALSWKA
jgi:peptidoglycan/xylan/chitin deacetylase (PgdA/CDA1 family)